MAMNLMGNMSAEHRTKCIHASLQIFFDNLQTTKSSLTRPLERKMKLLRITPIEYFLCDYKRFAVVIIFDRDGLNCMYLENVCVLGTIGKRLISLPFQFSFENYWVSGNVFFIKLRCIKNFDSLTIDSVDAESNEMQTLKSIQK
jgi:hypothetical protein